MTAVVTEIDIMSLIDWESVINCTADPCDNEASWLICPPCGDDFELCNECKEQLVESLAGWDTVHCKICNVSGMKTDEVIYRKI